MIVLEEKQQRQYKKKKKGSKNIICKRQLSDPKEMSKDQNECAGRSSSNINMIGLANQLCKEDYNKNQRNNANIQFPKLRFFDLKYNNVKPQTLEIREVFEEPTPTPNLSV